MTACALVAAACANGEAPYSSAPPGAAAIAPPESLAFADASVPPIPRDTVARDLSVPWGIAVAPDGRVFIAERPGRILTIAPDGARTTWATLDVYGEHEGIGPESGLLGLALAPDFATSGHVFVLATMWRSERDKRGGFVTRLWRRAGGIFDASARFPHENRILRFTDRDGTAHDQVTIRDGIPATFYHAGGALAFGPDGMLYAGVGDAMLPDRARDPSQLTGKILRLRADGTVPNDNPRRGSPVFARGLRNPQAFAWLPDGTMLGVDHGPTGMDHEGGRAGRDELNLIRGGSDYGWPDVIGRDTAMGITPPLWVWQQAVAPGGLTLGRDSAGTFDGTVLVAGLKGVVERVTLDRGAGGWRATARTTLLKDDFGRTRTLLSLPDGSVLLTTSNRDARGVARPGDDLLLRLRPSDDSRPESSRGPRSRDR